MTGETAGGGTEEPFAPAWDQAVADAAIGKTILIGMTYVSPDGETVRGHVQYHGVIVSADAEAGVKVECRGEHAGKTLSLPPDLTVFRPAAPGQYRLRSSGEIVVDPAFSTQWKSIAGVKH